MYVYTELVGRMNELVTVGVNNIDLMSNADTTTTTGSWLRCDNNNNNNTYAVSCKRRGRSLAHKLEHL